MSLSRDEVIYALGDAVDAVQKAQRMVRNVCVAQLLALVPPGTGLLPSATLYVLADACQKNGVKDAQLQAVLDALIEETNHWQKEREDESAQCSA